MKIIECPRDAMQGIKEFIPTEEKVSYIQSLLAVGFDVLDCGSFVSPKAIPQMADTAEVLYNLDTSRTSTQLSVIIANISGAKKAVSHPKVDVLGYPFSISETFQQRNTNRSRAEAMQTITEIKSILQGTKKELLVYFSMAFGNPYNDDWSIDEILYFTEQMANLGVTTINLSDTVGVANLQTIELLFTELPKRFSNIEFGAHLHTVYTDWKPKVELAYNLGCTRFDGAIKGFGGCPMAKDELVGNIPTEKLITFLEEKKIPHNLNLLAFESAYNNAMGVYG